MKSTEIDLEIAQLDSLKTMVKNMENHREMLEQKAYEETSTQEVYEEIKNFSERIYTIKEKIEKVEEETWAKNKILKEELQQLHAEIGSLEEQVDIEETKK